jgi:hypothetical protein
MSQIKPNAPLFELSQDHVAIKKLLALRTGLGTGIIMETHHSTSKVTGEINKDQNRINGQLKASRIFYCTLDVRDRKPNTRAQRAL